MAKLAARRRVGDPPEPEEFARPTAQLCAAGVDLSRAREQWWMKERERK
ncbi:MAG: hypothetical protein AB7S93_00615 [Xanthobacteraceae bacterium]